ncbi:MAG: CheR family methyltransferase [Xanthobacteraceae bacterium]
MTPLDYDFLRHALKQRSGLVLSADKHYFLESRLLPLARKNGFTGVGDLVAALKGAGDAALMAAVVEAMTTNESFFFRDKTPFEHFRRVIMPALLEARRQSRAIRIWCAAAASGQEPYSIAMCLREMTSAVAGWRIEIVATDLADAVLDRARQGLYSQFEVQRGLPIKLLVRYFTQIGELWQIAPEIRAMVNFRCFNLLSDFASLGSFDLVLCRNVLIYFDQETKSDVLRRMAEAMSSDGYLVLGAAETAVGLSDRFRMVSDRPGLYEINTPNPRLLAQDRRMHGRPRLIAISGGR